MGKAKRDRTTPKQPTAIERLAKNAPEQRAAMQEVVVAPELRAAMQRILAKDSPEERAKLEQERKNIDRAIAIRDGLIPPPWAEKLLKAASERKAEPKHTRTGKQMSRLLPVLRELYPPDGMPHVNVKTATIMQRVLNVYQARNWGEVSRDVVERAVGRRKR